ncbi:hypothetical protein ACFLYD_01330 [Chloroflexota bacterium]
MMQTTELDTKKHSRKVRFLRIALFACVIATLGLFLGTAVARVFFPYGLNYAEGPLMGQAERILTGLPLYSTTLDEPSCMVANYPPLYPSLIAGARAVTRLSPLPIGRVMSLLAALVSGLIIGLLATHLCGSRLSGLLAMALFLGHPFTVLWSSMARVDLLALALSLVALYLLYRRWQSWFWLAVAVLCLVASIYTRQTYALAVPLAGAIWLWYNDRRRALVFALVLALSCLFVFLFLDLATRGGFYLNIVVANVNRYRVSQVLSVGVLLLLFSPFVLVIGGAEIVQTLKKRPAASERQASDAGRSPFVLYGLLPYTVGAFLSALTVGKIGSDVNYFLELVVALTIWAAGALVWQPRRGTISQQALLVLMLCQLVWAPVLARPVQADVVARWRNLAAYDGLFQQVKEATAHGPVLADEHMEMVVLAGQRIYLQPFECQQLQADGLWDPAPLLQEITTQKFPLIQISDPGSVWFQERWSESMVAAIEEHYEGVEYLPGLVIYRPQGEAR